jgi:effector-binding domain-containing protein
MELLMSQKLYIPVSFTLFITLVSLLSTSCLTPRLERDEGKKFQVVEEQDRKLIYRTYTWDFRSFEDAIKLLHMFNKACESRGMGEYAAGRYPSVTEWQIGMIVDAGVETMEISDAFFDGELLEELVITGGSFATMRARGNAEYIFRYWKPLKRWVTNAGYTITSPPIELYRGTWDSDNKETFRSATLQYRILD